MADINQVAQDAASKASEAVNEAAAQSNAVVQEKGPEAVSFIQKYWMYGVGLLALLAAVHFVFGVNL